MKSRSLVTLYLMLLLLTPLASFSASCGGNSPTDDETQPVEDSNRRTRSSGGSSRASADYPLVFKTKSILEFEQLQGQAQWIEESRKRVQGATWEFNSDGTFTFAPANARTDLFPLEGKFKRSGDALEFSASAGSNTGSTGSASTEIQGKLDLSSDTPEISMTWVNSSGMSAVVANTPFASATANAYKLRATLTPAN